MEHIYPAFERGRILKKELLWALRDYSYAALQLQYQGYPDGILSGCELEACDGGLKIMPGILYYQKVPYFLQNPYKVPCRAEGEQAYIKVRFLGKTIGTRQEEYLTQIYIDEREPDANCELELGRFKLQAGARLRAEYVDFYDYETEFDTINRIFVPYAAMGQPGIWPQLLKCFAKELLYAPNHDLCDSAFCFNCLQLEKAMPYEAVKGYLDVKLRQDREYTNAQIYSALKKILRESVGKAGEFAEKAEKKEKTLLMI